MSTYVKCLTRLCPSIVSIFYSLIIDIYYIIWSFTKNRYTTYVLKKPSCCMMTDQFRAVWFPVHVLFGGCALIDATPVNHLNWKQARRLDWRWLGGHMMPPERRFRSCFFEWDCNLILFQHTFSQFFGRVLSVEGWMDPHLMFFFLVIRWVCGWLGVTSWQGFFKDSWMWSRLLDCWKHLWWISTRDGPPAPPPQRNSKNLPYIIVVAWDSPRFLEDFEGLTSQFGLL